jgi:hypothetical protein
MQFAVNTTIEEEVFSMWFAYIHCWAMDVFSLVPPRDCISTPVVTLDNSNHRHRRQMGKACSTPFSSICHNRNFRKLVCQYRPPVTSDSDKLKVTAVVRQIMTERSEAVSEEDKVMIVTIMVLDLMQRNGYKWHLEASL